MLSLLLCSCSSELPTGQTHQVPWSLEECSRCRPSNCVVRPLFVVNSCGSEPVSSGTLLLLAKVLLEDYRLVITLTSTLVRLHKDNPLRHKASLKWVFPSSMPIHSMCCWISMCMCMGMGLGNTHLMFVLCLNGLSYIGICIVGGLVALASVGGMTYTTPWGTLAKLKLYLWTFHKHLLTKDVVM